MSKIVKSLVFVVCLVLSLGVCGLVFGGVLVPVNGDHSTHVYFGYGNGSYYYLDTTVNQSFSRVERINNVWYFYPQVTPTPVEVAAADDGFAMFAGLLLLGLLNLGLVFVKVPLVKVLVGLFSFAIGVFVLSGEYTVMFGGWMPALLLWLAAANLLSCAVDLRG